MGVSRSVSSHVLRYVMAELNLAERREEVEEEANTAEIVTDGARERLNSETKAEVAREFRKTLNRRRPSRKRYSLSSAHYNRQQSAASLEASQRQSSLTSSHRGISTSSSFDDNPRPFVSSVQFSCDDDDGGVSLSALDGGGEAIYRECEEYESLSRVNNKLKKIIPQPIRKSLLPPRSWKEWRKFMFVHLPIIHWVWTYRLNQLIGDIIAGLTIGVTHIPQGRYIYMNYVTAMYVMKTSTHILILWLHSPY